MVAADVFEFLAQQRGDRTVIRISDRESGFTERTSERGRWLFPVRSEDLRIALAAEREQHVTRPEPKMATATGCADAEPIF